MWRRQIEVGHSFQIPFAGRNNLHLPPSCPLNRLHGNPPGAHGAETGLEFIISHFHGPLNCIRFRSTIIRLAGHFPSRSLSPSYLSSFPPRIFLLVRRTSLVNFRLKLLFWTSLVISRLRIEWKILEKCLCFLLLWFIEKILSCLYISKYR